MLIEASLPRLLAVFGVSCSVVLAGRTDSIKLIVAGMLMVFESGKDPEKYGKIGLPGALIALVGAICIFALYFAGLLPS